MQLRGISLQIVRKPDGDGKPPGGYWTAFEFTSSIIAIVCMACILRYTMRTCFALMSESVRQPVMAIVSRSSAVTFSL